MHFLCFFFFPVLSFFHDILLFLSSFFFSTFILVFILPSCLYSCFYFRIFTFIFIFSLPLISFNLYELFFSFVFVFLLHFRFSLSFLFINLHSFFPKYFFIPLQWTKASLCHYLIGQFVDRTWCLLTLSVNLRNGDISIDQSPFLLLPLLLLTSWFDKLTDCILLPILETKKVCNYPWEQFTKVSENSAFWKQTTPWLGSTEPVYRSNGIRLLLNSKEFFREVR